AHAPNLSAAVHRAADLDLSVPARAPARPRARRARRRVRGLQLPMDLRRPPRLVRHRLGSGAHPVPRPLDRMAAAGLDLLRPAGGVLRRTGGLADGPSGAAATDRPAVRQSGRPPPLSSPLFGARDVRGRGYLSPPLDR